MEIKKSPKADLEGRKQISLLMGYVIALAVLFVAFEWATYDVKVAQDSGIRDVIDEEEIEITRPENVPPPPPVVPPPVAADVLNVVEDDIKVDAEIASTDDSQKAAQVQTYTPPAVVEEEEESANHIFTVVEKAPTFPGGDGALLKFINGTVKYPVVAAENGIQGRVYCEFVVDKDGKIKDAIVKRGVDPSLDKEALRVINAMPAWNPGEQRGKPVKVRFTVPITFKLQ